MMRLFGVIFKLFDFWSLKRVVGPFLMSKYRVWIDVATAAAAVRDRREREKWTLWCLAQLQKWPSKHNRTELREPERAFANSRICEAKHSTPTTQLLKCVPALYHQAWSSSKKIGNTIHGKNTGSHKINGRYLLSAFFLVSILQY